MSGWGVKQCLFFVGFIFLAVFLTMIIYNKNFSDLFSSNQKEVSYEDIEKDLVGVARNYVNNYYYKVLENGDEDYVTIRDMQEKELITDVVDIEDTTLYCSGYVYFYKKDDKTNYKPYIKCGDNYTTSGYKSKYDEDILK